MSKASQEFVKLGPKAQMNALFRMLERIEAALTKRPQKFTEVSAADLPPRVSYGRRKDMVKLPIRPEITD